MRTGGAADPGTTDPLTRALGFAGLLPQLAAVLAQAWAATTGGRHSGPVAAAASLSALIYGAVILSFLGGIWWGLAMRRTTGQGQLALSAVVPSLIAGSLVAAAVALNIRWVLVALGSVIILTLLVDRHLTDTGEAPAGWMRLRVPLSVGLGGFTILAGVLAPR